MKDFKNLRKFLAPLAALLLFVWAWQSSRWSGVALVFTGIVMWLLLHFTNLMVILRRAKRNPIGAVDSAVMLNAQLKPGMSLLSVIGVTRALGALESPKGEQPEIFVWRDNSDNRVRAEFVHGKLVRWHFNRPPLSVPPSGNGP